MQCKNCGTEGAFDRIIIERGVENVVGVLCELCMREQFDPAPFPDHTAAECASCSSESTYVLAKLDLVIESDSGTIKEYELVDGDGIGMCRHHLLEAIAQPVPIAGGTADNIV